MSLLTDSQSFANVMKSALDKKADKSELTPDYVAQTTAPSDTSVLWVDTDDNTFETLVNYSTAEQDTGRKWIDGQTIYQRTYEGTTKTDFAANSVTIDSFVGKNLLNAYGYCGQYGSTDTKVLVPSYLNSTFYSGVYFDYEDNSKLKLFYGQSLSNSAFKITVFYTKST